MVLVCANVHAVDVIRQGGVNVNGVASAVAPLTSFIADQDRGY